MGAADLTLDLLACPACRLDGSGSEVAVLTSILDHCSEPVLAVKALEFAVRERIRKVAVAVRLGSSKRGQAAYPMTPIDERMSASLLFWSSQTIFNNEKIDSA